MAEEIVRIAARGDGVYGALQVGDAGVVFLERGFCPLWHAGCCRDGAIPRFPVARTHQNRWRDSVEEVVLCGEEVGVPDDQVGAPPPPSVPSATLSSETSRPPSPFWKVIVKVPGNGPPSATLDGLSDLCQWWTPNRAGHRRMVQAAGFDIVEDAGTYEVPLGPAHPPAPRRLLRRQGGILHSAVLAR